MTEPLKSKHIILCNCRDGRINPELHAIVENTLKEVPGKVTRITDLCGLVSKDNERISTLFSDDNEHLIIGCYQRTMSLLIDQIKDQTTPSEYLNLIDSSPEEVTSRIEAFCGTLKGDPYYSEITEESGWSSWFPVIDYSRCTACGQCADFCLFGVFEKTGDRVSVINPEGCKNLCPACARICPATAIIFPKYKNGGAIGGSDEIDDRAEQQRQAHDLEILLGNNIYEALQKRQARRKSIIRDDAMKTALSEREQALNRTKD